MPEMRGKMPGKVTYHQQISYCGKPRCRKCSEGIGHGPYWYAYETVDGHTTRTYIGKQLPAHIREHYEGQQAQQGRPIMSAQQQDTPHSFDEQGEAINREGMGRYRLFLLGQGRLERWHGQEWQSVGDAAWQHARVRALLSYLASSPGRRASRAQLRADLWAGEDEEQASKGLSSSVRLLRQLFAVSNRGSGILASRERSDESGITPTPTPGTSGMPYPSLLHNEGEEFILADQQQVWVDVDAFTHCLATFALDDALALYGGDFFPEERSAAWALKRRQFLLQQWVSLLLALADQRVAQGMRTGNNGAIEVLDRLLAHDPTCEAAVQRLIVTLAQLKRRGEALRVYQRFATALQREHDAAPTAETQALYEAVRRGDEYPYPGTHDNIHASTQPNVQSSSQSNIQTSTRATHLPDNTPPVAGIPASQLSPLPTTITLASEAAAAQPIGRTHQNPFVGRMQELESLHGMLLAIEHIKQEKQTLLDTQRGPQCVFLMGEAGIGKTRLAEEMGREAQRRGWLVLWSRVYGQESGIPYRPWIDVLRKVIHQSTLSPRLQPLSVLLPELQTVLPMSTPPAASFEQEQLRLWETTRMVFTDASQHAPLLIVLDDIQWSDISSCELLGYLARHLHNQPILLLCTCRDNEVAADHPLHTLIAHMQREHTVTTLHVNPLTAEQIGLLVSAMPDLPETMVQPIQTRSAGNPFFAEELARTINSPTALPQTIADTLDSRLSRLSSSCQRLLGNASVLGGSFELPVISSMETGSNVADEDAVLDLLEEALRAGVLTEEGVGTRITYTFWHPLLVSHLYERVSAQRRVRLHQRAATILQRLYANRAEEFAATITHHLVQGGAESAQIVYYAKLVGDKAYALPAYPEAARYYRLAVEHATPTDQPYFMERLAECAMVQGSFTEARRLYEDLLALRHEQSVSAAIPVGDPAYQREAQIQALLWAEIARAWRFNGDSEHSQQCCTQGEQVLQHAGINAGPALARLRYQQASLHQQKGRYQEARQAAFQALALAVAAGKAPAASYPVGAEVDDVAEWGPSGSPAAGDTQNRNTIITQPLQAAQPITRIQRTLAGDPVDIGRTHALIGSIAHSMGNREEALTHLYTALAIYEQYDQQREIAHASCNLGYVYLKHGEYTEAQAAFHRALNLAERLGDGPLISVLFSNLAELAASSGDYSEAEHWYKKGLALTTVFNDREYVSLWNSGLATVLSAQGKLSEAATCIRQAWRIGRSMHSNPCIGAALIALGNIRLAQADAAAHEQLPNMRVRYLARAKQALQRALQLEGLDAETRKKGEAALSLTTTSPPHL